MNLDFYRNFIRIVELGTISAAARELHIAQSALSGQVKVFEDEYGTALFVRNARKMELTDAGKIVYDKAKSIVAIVESSYTEVGACVHGSAGTVRIGMTQAFPDVKMVNLLLGFHRENPEVRFEFYELNSYQITELVRTGVVEIGIIRTTGLIPSYLDEQLRINQKICVYCSYNNPWLTPYAKEVCISSLDNVPIAISRGFADLLEDIFERSGIHPNIISISTSRSNPMMWADAGEAIAIICTDETETVDDAKSFCRALTSDDPAVASELLSKRAFITSKERTLSAAAQKFIEYSKKHLLSR